MGGKLTKYLEQLPLPGKGLVVATPTGPNRYSFTQTQISRRLHSQLPPTPLWAYDDGSGLGGQAGSFGLVLVAKTGTPVRASFTHAIPDVYPAWIPVDTRLTPLGDKVRLMTHLHGGFVAAESDGNPAITPNGFGPGETQTVFYTRPAATDRRFVAVVPRPRHRHRAQPHRHPRRDYEIPLVVQDRQYNPDGTLLYPVSPIPGSAWTRPAGS